MKAVLCETLDGPRAVRLADVAPPQRSGGEVLVSVDAVGLNFMDTLITRGRYQMKPALPFAIGAELSGRIADANGHAGLKAGDRVMAFVGIGAAANVVAVPAERIVLLPDAMTFEMAAGLSVTYGAALYALRRRVVLGGEDTIAILGASSGSGLAAIDVAKALGARVIAAASSDEKCAACMEAGAAAAVLSDADTLKDALRAEAGGAGPTVIYDCIGGDATDAALRALQIGGRYVVFGFAAGIPNIRANIALLKDCTIHGINWPDAVARAPDRHSQDMRLLLAWIDDGLIRPAEPTIRPIVDAAAALEDLEARRVIGKVVLKF